MNPKEITEALTIFGKKSREVERRLTAIELSYSADNKPVKVINRPDEINFLKDELKGLTAIINKIISILK